MTGMGSMRVRGTRLVAGAGIALLMATPLQAQSRSEALRACAEAQRRETLQAESEKRKQQTDAKAREEIGIRNCGTDRGCKEGVVQRYREDITTIANAYTLAIAESRKREIDCTTAAESAAVGATGGAGSLPASSSGSRYDLAAELSAIRANPLENLLGAADEFFKGLLDWGIGTLTFLAQPRGSFSEFGTPMKQVIDYLVNHQPNSFAQQYEKAKQGVEAYAANPARTLGRELPNLVPLPAAKAAEEANAAASAGRRLARLNAEAKRFAPLAEQLTRPTSTPARGRLVVEPPPLAGRERGPVVPPAGSADRGPPPDFGNRPLQPRSGVPASCFENQCWQNVQAVDHYWRTGVWKEPAARGYPLAEELGDLPAPGAIIMRDLRRSYGGAGALDPLHGGIGQQAQAHGIPVPSSRARIEAVMRQKGPGAQGFAFVRWERTVGNETLRGSHVVNVRALEGGAVEFFDRATQQVTGLGGAVEPALWQGARNIFFFLTHDGR